MLTRNQLVKTDTPSVVPPKVRGKRDRADRGVKPISGLDVAALLKQDPARKKLDPSNAVPEFKQMIEVSESMSQVEDAAKQMGNVIRDLITDSLGNSGYDQAIEDLGVFRAEMIDMMEPDFYNAFVTDLKKRLLAGELGGDRRELWWQMKGARLGLIDETQSETSKVTPAEAADVRKSTKRVEFNWILLANMIVQSSSTRSSRMKAHLQAIKALRNEHRSPCRIKRASSYTESSIW